MRIAALALIVALAGCAGPPPAPPVPAESAQAAPAANFCGAATIWLQHPALLSLKGQRRTDARMKRAAIAWLPATRDVRSEIPDDAPDSVRSTLDTIVGALKAISHDDVAEGQVVGPLTAQDLRRVLRYVKQECLSG